MSAPPPSPLDPRKQDIEPLCSLIASNEDWLMNRVLDYAKQRNYVKYTSTLAEAWRASIAGLSSALLRVMDAGAAIPELGPDEDFTKDPAAFFGIIEAQKHRSRGITISLFLGMMKYYRQSYLDLVQQSAFEPGEKAHSLQFVQRCFDRIELGFISEWCARSNDLVLSELQAANRTLTNDKNLYITLFESMPDPAVLFNERHELISANHAAMLLFSAASVPGGAYYSCPDMSAAFPAWVHALPDMAPPGADDISFTKPVNNGKAVIFEVRIKRVLDVGGRCSGMMAILKDVTTHQNALEALRKSEESFRSLFENSRDAIMLLDRKGFFDCNKTTLELFQCPTKEVFIARHPSHLSPSQQPDGRESLAASGERIEAAFAEGLQFFDWTHRRMDGSTFPAEVLLSRFDLGGRTVLQAVVRDITERKKAEQIARDGQHALQLKHAELNRVFSLVDLGKREWERTMDCVDDMVLLADSGGRIKRCNKSFAQFAGRPYDKILGEDWTVLLTEHKLEVEKLFEKNSEVFHKPTNRWFTVNSYAVTTGIGVEFGAGFVVTFHDFTERKNMTQRLEESNREIEKNRTELRNALEELSLLIQKVAKEKAFGIRFQNPHLTRCYDLKGCQKKTCPCYGREAERCWQVVGTHCGGQVQGAFAQKYENCVDCGVFQASTQNPVFQIGEHFNNMMSILELKNRELENAYNELKIAQGQVIQQEKMASIGQLAAGVAHEINNPTGFIMSNLGSLQKYVDKLTEFIGVQTEALSGVPEESAASVARQRKTLKVDFILNDLKSLVKESLDGADRIKKIVQDLKSFSRVDEADLKMADINTGIESTINIVWNELKYKATLVKEYGDIPQIKCNPGQLNQVFMNLLVNSAHAIEKQGEIRIRTWIENNAVNVSVADTGCGIPKDKINRIFEPFFTTKEVGKGTGLGLSIAYDIIKKHKGKIEVESEVGKGTTFVVRIPIAGIGVGGGTP